MNDLNFGDLIFASTATEFIFWLFLVIGIVLLILILRTTSLTFGSLSSKEYGALRKESSMPIPRYISIRDRLQLTQSHLDYSILRTAAYEQTLKELSEEYYSPLKSCIELLPVMGLIGTVTGLISLFLSSGEPAEAVQNVTQNVLISDQGLAIAMFSTLVASVIFVILEIVLNLRLRRVAAKLKTMPVYTSGNKNAR